MISESTYYLGRVIKLGQLNNLKLLASLQNPEFIVVRNNGWTFIDVTNYDKYLVGTLAKYDPEGQINIIDKEEHSIKIQEQSNLIIAQSVFIYIPEFSGIAFQKITSHIEPHIFTRRFANIIKDTNKDFFVDCEVELITDMRSFAVKLSKLNSIQKIKARVNPPNPLFGDLWAPLKEYLTARNTEALKIEENSAEGKSLNTSLNIYVKQIAEDKIIDNNRNEVPIGDAAILMAADGYGTGLVSGKQNQKTVTIKTSETAKNFTFDKIPEHQKLYKIVSEMFKKINDERHMKH